MNEPISQFDCAKDEAATLPFQACMSIYGERRPVLLNELNTVK